MSGAGNSPSAAPPKNKKNIVGVGCRGYQQATPSGVSSRQSVSNKNAAECDSHKFL